MKTTRLVKTRVSTITMDTENRTLALDIRQTYTDNFEETFSQSFNLNVMPYDMAMSVICSLINPSKQK